MIHASRSSVVKSRYPKTFLSFSPPLSGGVSGQCTIADGGTRATRGSMSAGSAPIVYMIYEKKKWFRPAACQAPGCPGHMERGEATHGPPCPMVLHRPRGGSRPVLGCCGRRRSARSDVKMHVYDDLFPLSLCCYVTCG